MSKFPQFDTAKIMIAASVRHCRITLEELPVGQVIVDAFGVIRSVDESTARAIGWEETSGDCFNQYVAATGKQLPEKLSPAHIGDMGEFQILAQDKTVLFARLVCVPGHHPQTFLLNLVFSSP